MLQAPLRAPVQRGTCFSGQTRLQQPAQECGCDATGRPFPAAPACSQLSPALPERGAGGGKQGWRGAALQGLHPSPVLPMSTPKGLSRCSKRTGRIKGGFTEARGVFPKPVFACAQVRAFAAPERCLLLRSCLIWPQPRGLGPGQSSAEQCPVCAVGRGVDGPAVPAAAGGGAVGCFHPELATGDSANRSHLIQIRAEQQVTPTLLLCLWGTSG